jgi:hypothetical protein
MHRPICAALVATTWLLGLAVPAAAQDAAPQSNAPAPSSSAKDAPQQPPASQAAPRPTADEPAGHALYDGMVAALRAPQSLYIECRHDWWAPTMPKIGTVYKLWLRKPNQFRMEAISAMQAPSANPKPAGILVGDGANLWIYWPPGRPIFSVGDGEEWKKTHNTSYMTKPTPLARHSISHEAGLLGAGLAMTIVDPSTFHGYTDSLQPLLDGVRAEGTEKIGDELCDLVHLSYMNGQREWLLWVAQRDHLPRKLREIVHVAYDITKEETWTKVAIDEPMADGLFVWKPPEGWTEWRLPTPDEMLIKVGKPAPDFEYSLLDGGKVKLSSFKGKVVWLVFWRVG